MEMSQLTAEVQNAETPVKTNGNSETTPNTRRTRGKNTRRTRGKKTPNTHLPSRTTRSQVVPEWTLEEMLILVNEIAAINNAFRTSLASYQRWKMISDNCVALGVARSSTECRRKWETMLAEYKKIRDWESRSGIGSYWCLESERKKQLGLPGFFERELFGSIDDFLLTTEERPSRFTRSQVVREWTIEEMLILVNEIAAINNAFRTSLSSYQRWKMISDNCVALGVARSSTECQRKWETMLAEYKMISDWESQSGVGSYWCLESERKKQHGLPGFFERELFGSIDDFLTTEERPSRFTRSQGVREWTLEEMLILVNEIATINNPRRKYLSSYQRLKRISNNCVALGVARSSTECRRKWETMLAEYKKIKDWETQSGVGSYWCLESERKKQHGLPGFFERELFGAIDDFLTSLESPVMDVVLADPGSEKRLGLPWKSNAEQPQEMARKLLENALLIHDIVRGGLSESAVGTCPLVDLNMPSHQTELIRQQGDELIKVLGTLASGLDQFVEMMQGKK